MLAAATDTMAAGSTPATPTRAAAAAAAVAAASPASTPTGDGGGAAAHGASPATPAMAAAWADSIGGRATPRTCGWLWKRGGTGGHLIPTTTWHRRYFVLWGDTLRYYLNEAEVDEHPAQSRGAIPLRGAGLYTAVHARYGARYFELHVPGHEKKYPLAADTDADYHEWLESLLLAIDVLHAEGEGGDATAAALLPHPPAADLPAPPVIVATAPPFAAPPPDLAASGGVHVPASLAASSAVLARSSVYATQLRAPDSPPARAADAVTPDPSTEAPLAAGAADASAAAAAAGGGGGGGSSGTDVAGTAPDGAGAGGGSPPPPHSHPRGHSPPLLPAGSPATELGALPRLPSPMPRGAGLDLSQLESAPSSPLPPPPPQPLPPSLSPRAAGAAASAFTAAVSGVPAVEHAAASPPRAASRGVGDRVEYDGPSPHVADARSASDDRRSPSSAAARDTPDLMESVHMLMAAAAAAVDGERTRMLLEDASSGWTLAVNAAWLATRAGAPAAGDAGPAGAVLPDDGGGAAAVPLLPSSPPPTSAWMTPSSAPLPLPHPAEGNVAVRPPVAALPMPPWLSPAYPTAGGAAGALAAAATSHATSRTSSGHECDSSPASAVPAWHLLVDTPPSSSRTLGGAGGSGGTVDAALRTVMGDGAVHDTGVHVALGRARAPVSPRIDPDGGSAGGDAVATRAAGRASGVAQLTPHGDVDSAVASDFVAGGAGGRPPLSMSFREHLSAALRLVGEADAAIDKLNRRASGAAGTLSPAAGDGGRRAGGQPTALVDLPTPPPVAAPRGADVVTVVAAPAPLVAPQPATATHDVAPPALSPRSYLAGGSGDSGADDLPDAPLVAPVASWREGAGSDAGAGPRDGGSGEVGGVAVDVDVDAVLREVAAEYGHPDFSTTIADHADLFTTLFVTFCDVPDDDPTGLSGDAVKALGAAVGFVAGSDSVPPVPGALADADVSALLARLSADRPPALSYAQFLAALLMLAVAVRQRGGGVPTDVCALRSLAEHHLAALVPRAAAPPSRPPTPPPPLPQLPPQPLPRLAPPLPPPPTTSAPSSFAVAWGRMAELVSSPPHPPPAAGNGGGGGVSSRQPAPAVRRGSGSGASAGSAGARSAGGGGGGSGARSGGITPTFRVGGPAVPHAAPPLPPLTLSAAVSRGVLPAAESSSVPRGGGAAADAFSAAARPPRPAGGGDGSAPPPRAIRGGGGGAVAGASRLALAM